MRLRVRQVVDRALRVELRRRLDGDIRDKFIAHVALNQRGHIGDPELAKLEAAVESKLTQLGLTGADVAVLVNTLRPRLAERGWYRPVTAANENARLAARLLARLGRR